MIQSVRRSDYFWADLLKRFDKDTLIPERVLHGARDLPRRLLQSPYEEE